MPKNEKETDMKRFIVTVVDYGESCDGKARVLGFFDSREEAYKFVVEDIKDVVHESGVTLTPNLIKMNVWDADGINGCEWNITDSNDIEE